MSKERKGVGVEKGKKENRKGKRGKKQEEKNKKEGPIGSVEPRSSFNRTAIRE